VRLKLSETPAFAEMLARERPAPVPLTEVVRDHGRALFGGTFTATACFAIFYLSTVFALSYGTGKLGYSRESFLGLQLIAILALAAGILVSGWLFDRYSARAVLLGGSILGIATGFLMGPMMGSGSPFLVLGFLSLALFVMGLVYGPLGGWLPSLFPARVRYTGASVAFNMAGILGGALAPNAAKMLSEWGGLGPVGWYLSGACGLSLLGLLILPQRQLEDVISGTLDRSMDAAAPVMPASVPEMTSSHSS
jgi:MFS family permease